MIEDYDTEEQLTPLKDYPEFGILLNVWTKDEKVFLESNSYEFNEMDGFYYLYYGDFAIEVLIKEPISKKKAFYTWVLEESKLVDYSGQLQKRPTSINFRYYKCFKDFSELLEKDKKVFTEGP